MSDLNEVMKKKTNKGTGTLAFSENLSQVMKARGLSLKQVAALSEVSVSVVQNWVEGKTPHDLHAVSMLAERLNIPFKKLLLGIAEKVDVPSTVDELFEQVDVYDGYAHIKLQKLIPKDKIK